MKILLIEPPKAPSTIGGEDVFLFEPLALEYLAAGVGDEHQIKIADLRLDNDFESVMANFDPDIVGITAYTVHVNVVKGLFARIKQNKPETLTVVGGHHATVMPEDFDSPSIDVIVMGEGVFAFREIVERHEKGETFHGIPGICFTHGDNHVRSDCQIALDLDSVPFPDRKLTGKYRKHYYSEWMKPLASIRTSKGCPYRCRFCAQWKVAQGKYFKRDPRKVVQELAEIEEECVFFADDESLVDQARMTELARLIREAGIKKRYFLYGRSDTITRNPELLGLWRGIGLERVFVGLEFFRDEDLAYIRKNSTSDDNVRAVRILHGLGIDVYASFIVRPEFGKADFAELVQYCRSLGLNFASFAVLTPLPGTDLYHEVKDNLLTDNYDYFDFLHPLLKTALPLKDFFSEFARLYDKSIAPGKKLSVLGKFPIRELPGLFTKQRRVMKQIRTAYLDYKN